MGGGGIGGRGIGEAQGFGVGGKVGGSFRGGGGSSSGFSGVGGFGLSLGAAKGLIEVDGLNQRRAQGGNGCQIGIDGDFDGAADRDDGIGVRVEVRGDGDGVGIADFRRAQDRYRGHLAAGFRGGGGQHGRAAVVVRGAAV